MPAPDEELKVRISADIGGLKRGISDATKAIRDFSRSTQDVGKTDGFDRMNAEIRDLYGALAQGRHAFETTARLVEVLNNATNEASKQFGFSSSQAGYYRVALNKARDMMDKLKEAQRDASEETKRFNDEQERSSGVMARSSGSGSRLVNTIGKMILYRALRSAISAVTQSFREGVTAIYQWDKANGGVAGAAATMDAYASALAKVKNSIGAAVMPALQALLPIVQRVAEVFATAANYVAQFFAILSGSDTYQRAKDTTVEWLDSTASSAGAATGAVQELKRSLMGFDELNTIQSNVSSGGGGGGGGGGVSSSVGDPFETVAVDQNFKEKVEPIINFVKENFDTILTTAGLIGAAILAWKFSTGFMNTVNALTGNGGLFSGGSAQKTIGIGIGITGAAVAAATAYGVGANNGGDLKDALAIALGAVFAGAGCSLAFGPAGWVATLAVGLVVAIADAVGTQQFLHSTSRFASALSGIAKSTENVKKATADANKAYKDFAASTKTATDRMKAKEQVQKALNTADANQKNLMVSLTIAQNIYQKALEEMKAAQEEAAAMGETSTKRTIEATKAFKDAQEMVKAYEDAIVENNGEIQNMSRMYAFLSDDVDKANESTRKFKEMIMSMPTSRKVEIAVGISETRASIEKSFPKKVKIPLSFVSTTQGIQLSETNSQISRAIIWGAHGGILDGATLIGAGEKGKEALLPLERNTEWMDMLADRIAGRGQHIQINMDGQAVYDVVVGRNNERVRRTGETELLV